MSTTEQWRPVPGFPGYEVSSDGRVVSHRVWRGNPGPRQMRLSDNGNGYLVVGLMRPSGVTKRFVHRLVTEAFFGPCPDGLEVRHLDGNPSNNAVTNLRYGSSSENSLDQVRHGTHPWASSDRCRSGGHPYTPENTLYLPSSGGRRTCRTCKLARGREYEARRAPRAACTPSSERAA